MTVAAQRGNVRSARVAADRTRTARAARRRQRRMRRSVHDLTADEWRALQAAWGGCAYCGATDQPVQRDCVLPISRGGRYTLDNVVPACRSCNASKCNSEVTTWMRRRNHDERAFLLRHLALRTTIAVTDPARHGVSTADGRPPEGERRRATVARSGRSRRQP